MRSLRPPEGGGGRVAAARKVAELPEKSGPRRTSRAKPFQASVADHFNSEEPREVFAGDDVRVQQMSKDGTTRNGLTFPIEAWPAVREAIDRAISEFKAAYPESPQ